jgi:hypothetical protein
MDLPNGNNDQTPLPESNGDVYSERPLTALEERQALLAHHVRLVARKMSHALFVFGAQGGLGKSRTILRTLDEEGIQPVLINSHVTPLALFGILFQHREDGVLFFDDVDSVFSSMPHLGLLRSALWGSPRIVTYSSSQLPGDLPPRFEFTSRVIFAANVIPKKNDAFRAVLSRCDQFELTATNEEIVDLMRSVSARGFDGLSPDDCATVIDYIAQHAEDRQLSMRLLGTSLRKLKYARSEGLDWRPLVKSQLQTLGRKMDATKRLDNRNKDMRIVQQALEMFPASVQDQQEHFCKVTGKSRASFYRALARYREEQGE